MTLCECKLIIDCTRLFFALTCSSMVLFSFGFSQKLTPRDLQKGHHSWSASIAATASILHHDQQEQTRRDEHIQIQLGQWIRQCLHDQQSIEILCLFHQIFPSERTRCTQTNRYCQEGAKICQCFQILHDLYAAPCRSSWMHWNLPLFEGRTRGTLSFYCKKLHSSQYCFLVMSS